jgi:hypothetical protein
MSEAQARWVAYRKADCSWRSRASTREADDTDLQAARKELEALQARIERPELRDATWARVEESLGDFFWTRAQQQDWGQAWPHYAAALEWWSAAKDVEAARARYLGMVWRMAWPLSANARENWYVRQIPLEVLENAVRIAQEGSDRARAQYLYALGVRNNGADNTHTRRAFAMLESAVQLGKGTPWYDDALFHAGRVARVARPARARRGGAVAHAARLRPGAGALPSLHGGVPEGPRAALGQRARGHRAHHEGRALAGDALRLPARIGAGLLAGLAQRHQGRTRAVPRRPDPGGEVRGPDARSSGQWIETLSTSALERVQGWTFDTHDDGRHVPGASEQTFGAKDGLACPLR